MPFSIVRNDISAMWTDCIVCPTDPSYSGGGGADYSIHLAAGPRLDEACRSLPPLSVGDVAVTEGYDLPVRYILHTMGPVWIDGSHMEEEQLSACYKAVLDKAAELDTESIAIPLISSGTFGFPKDRVLRVALDAVSSFLLKQEMTVYIVVYDKNSYSVSKKLMRDITTFIDDRYVRERIDSFSLADNRPSQMVCYNRKPSREDYFPGKKACVKPEKPLVEAAKCEETLSDLPLLVDLDDYEDSEEEARFDDISSVKADIAPSFSTYSKKQEDELQHILDTLDKGFSDTLLMLIDEKGMTDVECYKKANIDKKLFSKIRSNKDYRPKKTTVLAFAIALELDLEETKSLLEKAGYALSSSSTFDQIIRYFIQRRFYDMIEINMVLFSFDQPCLGNVVA